MSKKYYGIIETVNKVTGRDKEKKCNAWKWILAIVGVLAAIGGVAYALYRLTEQDCLEDFEEDFDSDFEDEFFEDEEDDFLEETPVTEAPAAQTSVEE